MAELSFNVVVLRNQSNIFIKFTWKSHVTSADQPHSIGLAFAEDEMMGMQDSQDRKIVYWDGSTTIVDDLYGCQHVDNTTIDPSEFCNDGHLRPSIPDTTKDITAAVGFQDKQAFTELTIAMEVTNETEDIDLQEGTHLEFVVNPFANLAVKGDGNKASDPLVFSFSPRSTNGIDNIIEFSYTPTYSIIVGNCRN